MKKIIFFSLIFSLIFGIAPVLAEEISSIPEVNQVANEVLADTEMPAEITSTDLDNVNTGWFSGLWRNVKIWVTRDPIKKGVLELEKADVELLKAKEMAQDELTNPKLKERLEKANAKYAEVMQRVRTRLINAKEKYPNNPQLNNFFDTFTDHEFKHQQILERLEKQVPENIAQMIKAKREMHLKKFGDVMNKLQNKQEFKARIIKSLNNEKIDIKHRIQRVSYIEELEKINPELKIKIEAAKTEGQELWQVIKSKREAILQSRQELKQKIKNQLKDVDPQTLMDNPEARQELIQTIRSEAQKIRSDNRQIRDEARQEVKKFREEHADLRKEIRDEVKPIIKKRIKEHKIKPVPQPVEPQPVPEPVEPQNVPHPNITY